MLAVKSEDVKKLRAKKMPLKRPQGFSLERIVKSKVKRQEQEQDVFGYRQPEKPNNVLSIEPELQDTSQLLVGVVPCYTKEDRLDVMLQSLVEEQTVKLDWILILLNGPVPRNGSMPIAEEQARRFAETHSNVEVIKLETAGKVNALNYSYDHIIQKIREHRMKGIDLQIPYLLYLDADVRCHEQMVEHLLKEIDDNPQAGGVMARYSFEAIEGRKYSYSEKSFLYGQRHEFATKTTKQQVRRRTEILGGQSTMFRFEALAKAAEVGFKKHPWNPGSKVEDAELTRTLQKLGYKTLTSSSARAWVDAMLNAYAWTKQREKWQDGHLEDLSMDADIMRDRFRISEQVALGWNVLIRMLFIAVVTTGLIMNMFSLDNYRLIAFALAPVILSILQSFSIARKIPDASAWEIVRSLLYIPGEIYYLRILSVWMNSMTVLILGLSRDGWGNQDMAESSNRRTNVLSWIFLTFGMVTISFILLALSHINMNWFEAAFQAIWNILTFMTIWSCIVLLAKWFGIFRARRRINP